MDFQRIYLLGRKYSLGYASDETKKRINYVRYPYTAEEVTSTTLIIIAIVSILVILASPLGRFAMGLIVFFGTIVAILSYIYPTSLYYTRQMMEYNEQMLRAVLSISNFIYMNTSIEYAVVETHKQIKGILKLEFGEIGTSLERRSKTTLGDAMMPYIDKWNEINPVFVKSLRLLQNASMAAQESKEELLKEITETLMLEFSIKGKRDAEDLANKAKQLILFGVLFPVMSLMMLPLVSIFMPHLIQLDMLIFLYNIIIPTFILLAALNFANKRIQIDTISLEEAQDYQKIPNFVYYMAIILMVIFAVPGIQHLTSIDVSTLSGAQREYQFGSIFSIWLITLGIALSIFFISRTYVKMHEKLWEDVKETEDDMPHLLESFSTLLSLNLSIERIIPGIVEDYQSQGFKNHPIVRVFNSIAHNIQSSKKSMDRMINDALRKTCPSIKVANILRQIIGFTSISQKSAVKSSKLIREQVISMFKLEDYMKTLLSETVALINVSVNMLMPLLCGLAVIMSLIIVNTLTYIGEQLTAIQAALGGNSDLSLVDITKIIPPTQIAIVVGFYFLEMMAVLTLFATKIDVGNDKFRLAKAFMSNMIGYVLFSIILLVGHILMTHYIFGVILGK